MIVKFTFFLFSNITLLIYLAFLLAFLFFLMLTYIFLKCNTFLFISQFFYNPIPISLFSDILFVKNLSLHFPIFHIFYLFLCNIYKSGKIPFYGILPLYCRLTQCFSTCLPVSPLLLCKQNAQFNRKHGSLSRFPVQFHY